MNKNTLSSDELRRSLAKMPRVSLGTFPTPLQDAPNLSNHLQGPRILVKREDLTGLGFGGNKVRHMEFVMGDAQAKGADIIININAPIVYPAISNNARLSGAAAKKAGFRYVCVVPDGNAKTIDANRLILELMGTEFRLIDTHDQGEVNEYTKSLAAEFLATGHVPYVQPFEPKVRPAGVMGYLQAALELNVQFEEAGLEHVTIWMPAGASHGGLTLAAKVLNLPWRVMGVIYSDRSTYFANVLEWSNAAAKYLDLPVGLVQEDLIQIDGFVGDDYSSLTPEAIHAVRLMAELEGTILEPLHTGKALAGLSEYINDGYFSATESVVFIHTGGLPELFRFNDRLVVR